MKHYFFRIMIVLLSMSGYLMAQEPLNIGTDDWPPYEMRIDGKISGYATEIIINTLKSNFVNQFSNELKKFKGSPAFQDIHKRYFQ